MTNFKYQSAKVLACASLLATSLTLESKSFCCCGSKDGVLESRSSSSSSMVTEAEDLGSGQSAQLLKLAKQFRGHFEQEEEQTEELLKSGGETTIDILPLPQAAKPAAKGFWRKLFDRLKNRK